MNAAPDVVIAAARVWLGTPYVHQASVLGAGCDCLGLARGIWRDLHRPEPVTLPPYTRDWGEAGGEEVLADAARRFLLEIPIAEAGLRQGFCKALVRPPDTGQFRLKWCKRFGYGGPDGGLNDAIAKLFNNFNGIWRRDREKLPSFAFCLFLAG